MPIQLAWRNLLHNPMRTAVALCGVAFAVTLIFLQLGFLGSVRTTASLIYDALDFDLMIRSPEYLYFADARDFPIERLQQIQELARSPLGRALLCGRERVEAPARKTSAGRF